jgi:hypothetical protein
MFRSIKCEFSNGTNSVGNYCNKNDRPTHIQQCLNRIDCIKFHNNAMLTFHKQNFTGIFVYENWSKCSVKCGLGYRFREAVCVLNTDNSIQLPNTYCDESSIEKLKIKCHLTNCTYKLVENWSTCSAQCGKRGIELLEKKCYETITRQFYSLSFCGITSLNNITRSCYKPCIRHLNHIRFEWKSNSWGNCSGGCGFGYKKRNVYCWNIEDKKIENDINCNYKKKLVSVLPCMNTNCGYGWFVTNWSKCSSNCSIGSKTRDVKCIKLTKEGHVTNEISGQCNLSSKPKSKITCNYGHCNSSYFWKPGNWSLCSSNCGFGNQRRIIECIDKNGVIQENNLKCLKESIPITHQLCFTNCKLFFLKNKFSFSINFSKRLCTILFAIKN